jgi:predicted exporter
VSGRGRARLAAWLALLALCAWLASRADYSADLAAFLPSAPTPAQQLLVDELREGSVSRLILVAVEGAPPERLAAVSRGLAQALEADHAFTYVANGGGERLREDGEFLLRHRYLLSPAVDAQRFQPEGLRSALQQQLDWLASPLSAMVSRVLPRDPTGEFIGLIERLQAQGGPPLRDGVWFSDDGRRALLVAQTRAAGFDIDAQQQAGARLQAAFAAARQAAAAPQAELLMTGPGVFAVATRDSIKRDAIRVTVIASAAIALLLLSVLRSPRMLLLTLLPVVSGALAGVAAVGLAFGSVHGITLGFGATLLGEAVDYAIYLFTRTGRGVGAHRALERIWPILRLGVLTSVVGFGAMLLSGFPGLQQLGLFSLTGLIVAVAVTRWVVPELVPAGFGIAAVDRAGPLLARALAQAHRLRPPLLVLVTSSVVWLAWSGGAPWNDELSSLSPVPEAEQTLDGELRAQLGAPDVRQLVVARAGDREGALQAAEAIAAALQPLVDDGALGGFDSPATFLPSEAAQRARQQSIPEVPALRRNLAQALQGLPFRADAFEPFFSDAARARQAPLLQAEDLAGTAAAMQVDSLLTQRRGEWVAMLPLRGLNEPAALEAALAGFDRSKVVALDLKTETDALYQGYRQQVLAFSALGAGAIVLLLLAALRSLRRIWQVLAPLAAALTVTFAVLVLLHAELTLFHLVAMLLVVGVGSNYTLFFDRDAGDVQDAAPTLTALLLCNLSTVIGFGVIGLASTPVLSAIGTTVAVGAALSLLFAAVMAPRSR